MKGQRRKTPHRKSSGNVLMESEEENDGKKYIYIDRFEGNHSVARLPLKYSIRAK